MRHVSRREFIKLAFAGSVAGMGTLPEDFAMAADRPQKHPNLVFVFPDEMRRQAAGCMEADPVITPNLDRLASEGLVLRNAVSNFPVCSPYRAMLFTGKYPFANGVIHNCLSADVAKSSYLRRDDRCLSDVLRDAGYSLGYIGKWHLEHPHEPYVEPPREWDGNVWDEWTPPERRHGFDFWYAYNCYDGHLTPHYWKTNAARDDKTEIREWSVKHEADVAIEYIENRGGRYRDPGKPFAVFVAHNPPHMPFDLVPEEYVERYGNQTAAELLARPNVDLSIEEGPTAMAKRSVKNYFAAVTGIDENLGRILDSLEKKGLDRETIVVFTADHGEMMGSHNLMYKNQIYEESLGIPFIIRWPGKIEAGSRDDVLFSAPDVMPTLLGLMNLGHRIPEAVQGADHSDVFFGTSAARPDSALYMEINAADPEAGRRGLRTPRYTFVVGRDDGERVTLFDNETDPYQMRDVAAENPALVADLTEKLENHLRETGDPWARTET